MTRFMFRSTIALLLLLALPVAADSNKPQVVMETTAGTIVVELFTEQAPVTVKNFLDYVDSGFYNGTIFHRVIPNFMIQTGGFTSKMDRKETKAPIKNESDNLLYNEKGTLAMARTQDPDSASSQFFINLRMNPHLNYRSGQHGYAVFGKVIEGMDIVDKIARTKTGDLGPFQNVPIEPIIMTSVHRLPAAPKPATPTAVSNIQVESE